MASKTGIIIGVVVLVIIIAAVAAYLASQRPASSAYVSATTTTTQSTATTTTTSPQSTATATTSTTTQAVQTVTIGALLPLTGALQSYGLGSQCAVQLAVHDANQMFASKGIQFQLVVQDTATDPNTALQKLQTLYAQGIRFVVGPMASAEVSAVMGFAEQNHIIIVSQSSTSPALAVPKPYVFRLVPTDFYQGNAIAALLHYLGVKRIVIVYRSDTWGQGLSAAIANASAKYGIQVLGSFGYDPSPSAMPAAEQAAVQKASQALGTPGPDAAFVMVTFEQDGVAVAQAAASDPVLSKVRWIGTDGIAGSTTLLQGAGKALAAAKFLATIAAPNPSDPRYQQFVKEYTQFCGHPPVAYDPYAYDAAMFIMTAIAQTGSTDPTVINSVLEQWGQNGTYVGVTGPVYLDQYHDRIYANYLIMGVAIVNGTPTWINAGFYEGRTGQITVFPQGQPLFSS
ncbi:ABC transporter substrate-binding protein [Thermoproteus tenax]|uniref:Branched-chain amino acid transport system substrate-binding protein n=2 Tax=Thermoproteus tenax TaxID=2271 RepID=G4RJN5_THETK|nr:penicillin-binding protein activator [Thermoproteus tenax]CAP46812.1 branched-chain amino acid transport, periplasmic component 2 [Thermoproteus tenax Kra 1]CCC81780.1 branched-chain amino acid transport system substrate-binding protein [Thermoproteus tenax Kra 1]